MADNPFDYLDDLNNTGKSVTVKLPPPKPVATTPKAGKALPKISSTSWDYLDGSPPETTKNEVGPGVDRELRQFGEGAARGLTTVAPYILDVLNSLRLSPTNTGSGVKDALLGQGPLTEEANDFFTKNYQTVTPQGEGERVLSAVGQGVGAGLPGGAMGVISGVTGGLGSEGAHAAFPDSEWAPLIGGLVGAVVPGGAHAVLTGKTPVARGMSHPDFETFADNVIPDLEGGGTLDAPKVNPKSKAFGPMQVTPDTLRKPGYGIKPWNGTVEDSVRVGRDKFAALLDKYDGDTEKALAAYNWGEGNVDKAVEAHGSDWLQHAPTETQNYVGKGMLKAYGGGDLPANGSVRPMGPEDIAGIMNDPEAAGIGDSTTAQPIEVDAGNVTDLGKVRNALDNQKVRALVEDKLDNALDHFDAVQNGDPRISLEDASANRKIAEQLNAMLPEDHAYKGMTQDLVDTWRSVEDNLSENLDVTPPESTGANALDKFKGGQRGEPLNDINEADAADREGLYGRPEPTPQDVIDEAIANRQPPAESRNLGTNKNSRQTIKDRTEPPRKSEDGHPDDMPPPSDEPTVRKLVEMLEAAKPLSNRQKISISKQRGERFAKVAQIYATSEGPAAYRMAKAAMKGEMDKVHFEPIGQHFDANEIQFLFDKVGKSNRLTPGEKLTGQSGLEKLLSTTGVRVPTKSELDVLSHVFPKELIDATSKENKFAKITAQVLNTPRTIMASFDLSAPFRQGVFLVGRPEFYKAWMPMLRSFFSEKYFQASQAEIASRPTFRLMQKAGLALTEEGGPLMKREEQFMSNWIEKVPVLGKGVRASSRAYMGFLNKLRADTFDTLIKQAANEGIDLEHDYHALHSIARFVNNATGRGDLGRWNTAAPVLNGLFFSPRLIASRVNMMNPIWYQTLHPFARKQALKSLLSFSAIAFTILGLAKMGGAEVEADPRSSDFGKIKTGNTRYDILGGFQQYIRLGAQMITNSQKNADGSVQSLAGGENAAGRGLDHLMGVSSVEDADSFRPTSRGDRVVDFTSNKFSPIPAFVWSWWTHSNPSGGDFDAQKQAVNQVIPLVMQDANDLRKDGGMGKIPGVIPGVFGVGVQTYQPREKGSSGRPSTKDDPFGYLNDLGAGSFDYLDQIGKQQ
jgi:hypothetical protein